MKVSNCSRDVHSTTSDIILISNDMQRQKRQNDMVKTSRGCRGSVVIKSYS